MNWKTVKKLDWIFTLNNPTEEDYTLIINNIKSHQYNAIILGIEIGKANTPHIQGYVQFRDPKNLHQIKRKFLGKRAHLQHCKSVPNAIKYCIKGGKWISISYLGFIKLYWDNPIIFGEDKFNPFDLPTNPDKHFLLENAPTPRGVGYRHGASLYHYRDSMQETWIPINIHVDRDHSMMGIIKLINTFFKEISEAWRGRCTPPRVLGGGLKENSPPQLSAAIECPVPKRQKYDFLKEMYFDEI